MSQPWHLACVQRVVLLLRMVSVGLEHPRWLLGTHVLCLTWDGRNSQGPSMQGSPSLSLCGLSVQKLGLPHTAWLSKVVTLIWQLAPKREKKQKLSDLLKVRLRTGSVSLLSHCDGQSKPEGQPRFKGSRNKLPLFRWGATVRAAWEGIDGGLIWRPATLSP